MITAARTNTRHAVRDNQGDRDDAYGQTAKKSKTEDLISKSSGIIASSKVCLNLKTAQQNGVYAFVTFCKHQLQGIETDLRENEA